MYMENGVIPLSLFIITGIIWALTIFQSHRLLYLFRKRFPEVAAREIPDAFSTFAHPEKAVYFLRRRTVELLRQDALVWKERQRFVWFTVGSLVIPTAGFCAIVIYAAARS